mgnify:CR=1 FL=1
MPAALKDSQTAMLADIVLHPIRDEEEVCRLARWLLTTCPECRSLILLLALSPADIKQKWDDNRVSVANCGTWMHLTFEFYLNRCCLLEINGRTSYVHQLFGNTGWSVRVQNRVDDLWHLGRMKGFFIFYLIYSLCHGIQYTLMLIDSYVIMARKQKQWQERQGNNNQTNNPTNKTTAN